MTYRFNDETIDDVYVHSRVSVRDVCTVCELGRELLKCFDRHGVKNHDETERVFTEFHKALYGAGFVMGDFNGTLFDSGPGRFIVAPGLAAMVARASNFITLRMFLHTMARSYRHGYSGYGYPAFAEAYTSGGLRAIIERLEEYCEFARRRGWTDMGEDPELDLIRPSRCY